MEAERTLKEADEAVHAAEHKADILRADLERQAKTNAEVETASPAAAAVGPAVEPAVEPRKENQKNSFEAGNSLYDKSSDSPMAFRGRFDEVGEVVRMAEAKVVPLAGEIDIVKDEMTQTETTAAEAKGGGYTDIAEATRSANEESATAGLAALAAAERTAAAETKLRQTNITLRKAKEEADRLRVEVEIAQADGAMVRAAAQEERGSAMGKIAHLEGVILTKERENTRSREVAESKLEELMGTLTRTETNLRVDSREGKTATTTMASTTASAVIPAGRQHDTEMENGPKTTPDLANGVGSTTEERPEPVAASMEATPHAVSTACAPQQQHRATMETELRVAETAVLKATEEVDCLHRELDRVRKMERASAVRRDVAESRTMELKREMDAAEQEHTLFRERVEVRLEVLRTSFEEEELESGVQVRGIRNMPQCVEHRMNGSVLESKMSAVYLRDDSSGSHRSCCS